MIASLLLAAAAAVPAPPVVAAISFDADGAVERSEVERLIEVRAGMPLDADAVRRSLANLAASDRFRNIWVESESRGDSRVDLVFHLYRAILVRSIRFENSPAPSDDLLHALGFQPGDPLEPAEVDEGAGRIHRLLATDGYAESTVSSKVEMAPQGERATVVYRVVPGPPTLLAQPVFDGDPGPFAPDVLARELKLPTGTRYREDRARKAGARLQDFLLGKGYLKAEVSLVGVERGAAGARPVFRVEVGPYVVFETKGVTEGSVRSDFRSLLEKQVFQEDLLASYVDSLRRRYQESGYHDARVEYRLEAAPDRLTVGLTVDRGAKKWIEAIRADGVSPARASGVRDLILTRPRSLLHRGYLVDDVLDDDRRAVESFYRRLGYAAISVGAPAIVAGRRPETLDVTIPVREGVRTLVRERKLEGCEHVDEREVSALISSAPGRPFDPQALDDDRAAVVSYYRNRGWTQATVRTDATFSDDRTAADLTIRITEGERSFFGKTVVRGLTRSSDSRARIPERWREGEPFSESRVLEAQRELSRTGAFQKIATVTDAPDPATGERRVLFDLSEGRPLALLYGVGYQYEETTGDQSPFGILGISYNNLFGNLQSVSVEGRYAPTTGRGRALLNFREPYLFDLDLPLTFTAFLSREPIQKIDVRRRGAFVEATKSVDSHTRVGLRWEFQKIQTGSDNPLDLEQLQTFDRSISETTVGATVLYDRRDDPIEPHEGIFLNGFVKKAFPSGFLGADARYLKIYGQASAYVPFLGGVLAGSIRAGAISVTGGCRSDTMTPSVCIPIAERFFSGGRTSDRGFDTNVQGVPDQTVDYSVIETPATPGKGNCPDIDPTRQHNCDFGPRIVGGAGVAGWNAEWRFPIAGGFGGTIFYDATQVWPDSKIRFKVEGADGLRQSIGLGIRYATPVGPLRFEYGRVLHRRSFSANVLVQEGGSSRVIGVTTLREAKDQIFLAIGYPF